MQKFWHHAVAITDLVNPKTPPTVKYLYGVYDPTGKKLIGPVTYNNTSQISPPAFRVVSVNDFYHRQMNQADLNKLSLCDRALLDASAYWAYNRAFQPGDYLVLIAMHIMTKEQPDWTFQSLWYSPDADKPDKCRYCSSRPTNLSDKTFQHYLHYHHLWHDPRERAPKLLRSTQHPTECGYLACCVQPYIELAASHLITTNCMNCHHRAAWPPFTSQTKSDEGRASTYLQETPPNPNALEVFPETAPIFNGLLTVDSMWAVSDHAGYPPIPMAGAKKTSPKKAEKK